MKRFGEMVRSVVARESVVQRFEAKGVPGSEAGFHVLLSKGVEYVVRGEAVGGRTGVRLSLTDQTGAAAPVYSNSKGTVLSIVPEKEGLYHVTAAAGTSNDRGPLSVSIVLSKVAAPRLFALEFYTATPAWMMGSETGRSTGFERYPYAGVLHGQSHAS